MTNARLLVSKDTNPHRNLAREEALLLSFDSAQPDAPAMLYLWQNAATVVIGRNQNAWRECRTALLEQEGGVLARRTTGGGAVFHDLGNLNFSFLLPRGAYNLERQLSVIRRAVQSFGIDCAFSGRNDLIADGRKFSGNAFRFTKAGALHHGTLMVAVDPEKLGRYLSVSPEKLTAKGVQSVRSRIVNLSELANVTIDSMKAALAKAFWLEYGVCDIENADALELPEYDALATRNATWAWNYGATPAFDASFQHRFSFGGVELLLALKEGFVADATVYTDAMEPELSETLRAQLLGSPFTAKALGDRVGGEIGAWLASLDI